MILSIYPSKSEALYMTLVTFSKGLMLKSYLEFLGFILY